MSFKEGLSFRASIASARVENRLGVWRYEVFGEKRPVISVPDRDWPDAEREENSSVSTKQHPPTRR